MSKPKVTVVWTSKGRCSRSCSYVSLVLRDTGRSCDSGYDKKCRMGFAIGEYRPRWYLVPDPKKCPGPGVHVLVPEEELKRLIAKKEASDG